MEEHVFVDGATEMVLQLIVLFERMLQRQIKPAQILIDSCLTY